MLGTYEKELNSVIEEACAAHPSLIVDVGAAEGYYACGMALRNPQARVVAFEMQAKGRGMPLPFVLGPAPLPLPLRVQLRAQNGNCWEAVYTTARLNDGIVFKASSQ